MISGRINIENVNLEVRLCLQALRLQKNAGVDQSKSYIKVHIHINLLKPPNLKVLMTLFKQSIRKKKSKFRIYLTVINFLLLRGRMGLKQNSNEAMKFSNDTI